jgi:hypothetical protein
MCKKIHRGGNAEQYDADKKYKEAVAVAVEACADDTKGQTCFICTQALHWKTKEGLVRGCACRGTAGFAHVSCLAEQAKILVAEAEENNLDLKVFNERFKRWYACSLCGQDYHGVVKCALAWACWKTYLGRPETDWARVMAMNLLGMGLSASKQHEDALTVKEANLALLRRLGRSEDSEAILTSQTNIAFTLSHLDRDEEALELERTIYRQRMASRGKFNVHTIRAALNLCVSLSSLERFEEARALAQKTIPAVRCALGPDHDLTLCIRRNSAETISKDPKSTLADLRQAETTLRDVCRRTRQVFGAQHPETSTSEKRMRELKAILAKHNSGGA